MGVLCLTGANRAEGAIPTVWVGEPAWTRSGYWSSNAEQLVLQGVVVGVGYVRGALEVVLRVVALDERTKLFKLGPGRPQARRCSRCSRQGW